MNGGLLLAGDDVINSSRAAPEQRCSRQHGHGADYHLCILSSNGRCEEKLGGKYMSSIEKGDTRADIAIKYQHIIDKKAIGLHGCPENFRVSLTTPTATIPNIFYGMLFGSTI